MERKKGLGVHRSNRRSAPPAVPRPSTLAFTIRDYFAQREKSVGPSGANTYAVHYGFFDHRQVGDFGNRSPCTLTSR